nr:histone H2A-beta, sperm-like [Parasteatoda tepidariorum]
MNSRTTTSKKSGLTFPVARIITMLRVRGVANRITTDGGVYFTAVLEYLTAEILELALNAARTEGSSRIQPRHLNIALRSDLELFPLFRTAIFPESTHHPDNNVNR